MATQDIHQGYVSASVTRTDLAESVSGLIRAVRRAGTTASCVKGAVADLSNTEQDLRQGNRHFACLKAAWNALSASEDIALKAPEVAHHLQQVGALFGLL